MMRKGMFGAGAIVSGALLFFMFLNMGGNPSAPPAAAPSTTAALTPNAPNAPALKTSASNLSADEKQHNDGASSQAVIKTLTVKLGDTLSRLLGDAGIPPASAHEVIGALKPIYDPRKIQAGQSLTLTLKPAAAQSDMRGGEAGKTPNYMLSTLTMPLDYAQKVEVRRNRDGAFTAETLKRQLITQISGAEAPIASSLFLAGQNVGVPTAVMSEMVRLYSWDVDFQRDIRPGDSFQVMYERQTDKSGATVHTGDIVYAELKLSGIVKKIYRYRAPDGTVDYFDEKGQSARKALMRTPIDGARLSSGFGRRRDPILGYSKMHRGTDFAAPRGTPIYAAGNGTIDYIGRRGGYGNYVRIRHNQDYSTAYGHMNRFAKGMYKGKRVTQGQVIGYVGSTGRSTGPHLHFEVLHDGRQVNPMTVKMPSGEKLHGKDLKRFIAMRDEITQQWTALDVTGHKMAQR